VFVAAGGSLAEDDGYLMTYVYDANSDSSDFVVLDAATMSSDPVATVHLPRIPFGFHGNWVPASVAD
jgi:carotenoid cleavage dioxygenase-like enzyme